MIVFLFCQSDELIDDGLTVSGLIFAVRLADILREQHREDGDDRGVEFLRVHELYIGPSLDHRKRPAH
jgi:hypothetical protein